MKLDFFLDLTPLKASFLQILWQKWKKSGTFSLADRGVLHPPQPWAWFSVGTGIQSKQSPRIKSKMTVAYIVNELLD